MGDNTSLSENSKQNKQDKQNVGIVGIYTVGNFGGALTYYALYNVVKNLGYNVLMIERPKNAPHQPGLCNIYIKDPYQNSEKAPFCNNKREMHELNKKCDIFLVGSDQMFNDFLYHQFGEWVTLDWVDDNKKKIAYAASFGHDYIWQTDDTRSEMAFFMKKFDAFSVREESGVKICDEEFGVKNAQWVLDPVFLCDKKYYEQLINDSQAQFPEHYLGAYILDLNSEKQNIINKISQKLSLQPQIYSEMNYKDLKKNGWTLPVLDSTFINDRLKNIADSDFFVADSFHGICFAIIFRKNFIAIMNKNRGASRFLTILSKLGLKDRLIESENDISKNPQLFEPVDYDSVYEKLNAEKDRCIKWLSDALADNHKKSYSDYDYWKKITDDHKLKLKLLISQNNALQNQVELLSEAVVDLINIPPQHKKIILDKIQLRSISNIYDYLLTLQNIKDKYIIVMTVKDSIGLKTDDKLTMLLNMLGFNQPFDALPKLSGYIGIVNKGNTEFDILAKNKETELSAQINNLTFKIISKPYKHGNNASVIINDCEYVVNKRGMNFVVYHEETDTLIDSVVFDTNVSTMHCDR